jgi:release factor glutamine methyltransferase
VTDTPIFAGVAESLRTAANLLSATSDTPRLDAELLMAHALGVERQALLLDPGRYEVPDHYANLVATRMAHTPMAYILGYRDFWTIRIEVGPGVLIPRPDSETLVEACLDYGRERGAGWPKRVLDLGTGPGTLLLAVLSEFPEASGIGVDASEFALAYARDNAEAVGMGGRTEFRSGDWGAGVDDPFDLILCNPPYIGDGEALMPDVAEHEPPEALFAGADGLDDYRRIIPDLPRLLAPDGIAVLEIGASQHISVRQLAEAAGFAVACRQDLGGRDRALILSRSPR